MVISLSMLASNLFGFLTDSLRTQVLGLQVDSLIAWVPHRLPSELITGVLDVI